MHVKMERITRMVTILILAFNCLSARAQLTFEIDSLVVLCYDDFELDDNWYAWEKKELYSRGPDLKIYGVLTNKSDSTVILSYSETDSKESIDFKIFELYISYHYKIDYLISIDPLFNTDFMTFPFINGTGLPEKCLKTNGIDVRYSVIESNESIPLAFETLSVPRNHRNTSRIKRRNSAQKKMSEAIKSSIKVIPVIIEPTGGTPKLCWQQVDSLSRLNYTQSSYDYESSIPHFFLDIKPMFSKGGTAGFYIWLENELRRAYPLLSERDCQAMIVFVVSKNGDIIYSELSSFSPIKDSVMFKETINEILSTSPKWQAGELNGEKVDSRITLFLTISGHGKVVDLSIKPQL